MGYKSAIISLALTALVFSASTSSGWAGLEDQIKNAEGMSLIGPLILAMSMLIALAYAGGQAFNQPILTLWAKEEFKHLLVSIMFLILIITLTKFVDAAFTLFFQSLKDNILQGTGDPCLTKATSRQTALCEIRVLTTSLRDAIYTYGRACIQYQRDASAYINFYGIKQGVTFSKNAYERAWAINVELVQSQFAFPAYMLLKAQQVFFEYFYTLPSSSTSSTTTDTTCGDDPASSLALNLLLPIAVICRFFPFLRNVGNFFFALALGFYSLFPALLASMYVIAKNNGLHCTDVNTIIEDPIPVFGDCSSGQNSYNLFLITQAYPFAVLYPNLALGITATFCICLYQGLKGYG